MTIHVATWMYVEGVADSGLYPQVGGLATDRRVQDIYWQCVYVFFSMANRFFRSRTDVSLELFTNVKSLPTIDGVNLADYLAALGVTVIRKDYTWRPASPRKLWYNQYYVFDILNHWALSGRPDDYYIVCDSDCIFVRNPDALFQHLIRESMLLIDVDTKPDELVNGITRRQAAVVSRQLGAQAEGDVAPYFGGEFYGLSHANLELCMQYCDRLFRINNDRASAGELYLSDEAHLFSLLVSQLGYSSANADQFVRRIFTGQRVNNTRASDLDLTVWHVPSEKLYGLQAVFNILRASPGKLSKLPDSDIRAWLAPLLGVGKIYPSKFLGHTRRAVMRKLRRILRSISPTAR